MKKAALYGLVYLTFICVMAWFPHKATELEDQEEITSTRTSMKKDKSILSLTATYPKP